MSAEETDELDPKKPPEHLSWGVGGGGVYLMLGTLMVWLRVEKHMGE